jgi:hypothetical protein
MRKFFSEFIQTNLKAVQISHSNFELSENAATFRVVLLLSPLLGFISSTCPSGISGIQSLSDYSHVQGICSLCARSFWAADITDGRLNYPTVFIS